MADPSTKDQRTQEQRDQAAQRDVKMSRAQTQAQGTNQPAATDTAPRTGAAQNEGAQVGSSTDLGNGFRMTLKPNAMVLVEGPDSSITFPQAVWDRMTGGARLVADSTGEESEKSKQ